MELDINNQLIVYERVLSYDLHFGTDANPQDE
jgi:hypothetical protein